MAGGYITPGCQVSWLYALWGQGTCNLKSLQGMGASQAQRSFHEDTRYEDDLAGVAGGIRQLALTKHWGRPLRRQPGRPRRRP